MINQMSITTGCITTAADLWVWMPSLDNSNGSDKKLKVVCRAFFSLLFVLLTFLSFSVFFSSDQFLEIVCLLSSFSFSNSALVSTLCPVTLFFFLTGVSGACCIKCFEILSVELQLLPD